MSIRDNPNSHKTWVPLVAGLSLVRAYDDYYGGRDPIRVTKPDAGVLPDGLLITSQPLPPYVLETAATSMDVQWLKVETSLNTLASSMPTLTVHLTVDSATIETA